MILPAITNREGKTPRGFAIPSELAAELTGSARDLRPTLRCTPHANCRKPASQLSRFGMSGLLGSAVRRREGRLSAFFLTTFLTTGKRGAWFGALFVSFQQQAFGKGDGIPCFRWFGDCMTVGVLYFQSRKRGGGSSVF